jgi:hypothetical protein
VIPFQWIGQPRLANAVLAMLAALALHRLLATWYGEVMACLGLTVLLES